MAIEYTNIDSFEFNGNQIQTNKIGGEVQKKAIEVGSLLHSNWQEEYRKANPEATERIKETSDDKWKKRNNKKAVDILNTDFENLPLDWQGENKNAGDLATALVDEQKKLGNDINIEELASKVHEGWMERNPLDKNPWNDKNLYVDYNELPESEKEKDRAQIKAAL